MLKAFVGFVPLRKFCSVAYLNLNLTCLPRMNFYRDIRKFKPIFLNFVFFSTFILCFYCIASGAKLHFASVYFFFSIKLQNCFCLAS